MESKKIGLFLIFNLFFYHFSNAQKQLAIELTSDITYSLGFNIKSIVINNIDSAAGDLGYVQIGAFNKYRTIYFENGLSKNVEDFLNQKCISNRTLDTFLLVKINSFKVHEITSSTSEHGYFNFNADYYIKKGNQYFFARTLDTLVDVSGLDVTKKIIRRVGETIFSGAVSCFEKNISYNKGLTMNEVLIFDSIQKSSLKIYNQNQLKRGIYKNWEDLKYCQPSFTDSLLYFSSSNRFYYKKENGKKGEIVDPKKYMAIFGGRHLYFSNGYGFYKSYFKNGNWYVIAPGNFYYGGNSGAFVGAMMFGLVGGIIMSAASAASGPNYEMLLFKLNYKNGALTPLREIEVEDDDNGFR